MKRNYKGSPPNPLFEKWLTEMRDQAAANDNPIQHSFGKALSSLRKCPIRLETGKDCLILQYFGKKICDILDKKLNEYKKTNNLPSSSRPSSINDILGDEDEDEDIGGKRAKKVSTDKVPNQAGPRNERPNFKVPRNKPYIPKVGSGAHAILTTMYNAMQEPNYPGYMLKKDIMSLAQRHCDSPMKSNAIEHYSGWSSMSTLISKHYVIKKSNPAKYSLTDSGVALALSLIEGRAKHHRDSDDESEDDDNACNGRKKPQNTNKNKRKPKASSSVSSESDSAKPSISGLGNFENRFSDSDEDDVCKQDYLKTLETNKAKTKEPQFTIVNSDDELEAALTISLTDTKSKKPPVNLPSKKESKTDTAFEDELEMALAVSLNETKMKNDVNFDDHNDDYLADHNKKQKNSIVNQKDEVDEDEDFKRALAMSLNESKVKNDIDVGVENDIYLSDDEKLKTNGVVGEDTEIDEDLKRALAMSVEEALLREAHSNGSSDDIYDTGKRSRNEFVSTKRSKADAGLHNKKVNEDEIICLDDDDDDDDEDSFEKKLKNDSEPKSEDKNVDYNESYIEFCKENVEPTLCVKKKGSHFIFIDGPSNYDSNDENYIQKENDENVDRHSTSKKFDGRMNNDLSNRQQISPKKTSPIDYSKKIDFVEEIVISDDDENVDFEIPAKADIVTSIPTKNVKTPTKDKPNKENSQLTGNFEREDEFPKFTDFPSTSKNSNVNPSKSSKTVKEKENSQINSKSKETPEDEHYDSFILLPNNFDIVLLVDTQETSGTKKKPTDDATMSALSDAGVLFEVRSLKVGDFAWIARCRVTQKELILPYIIERKRLDDLGGSITDGRYHEQKHRLRQSGINNVIYLIEHYGKTYHGAIPLTSLFQAGINTTVQDNFITKFTRDHKDSMFYVAALTRKLIRMYKSKELISCPKKYINSVSQTSEGTERLMEFSEFNKAALKTKQFTVQEMLIKQLIQLKGMSAEKAIGIAELYPSPRILAEELKNGGKNLLADIEVGSSRRKIGPAISNVLHLFYTRANLN